MSDVMSCITVVVQTATLMCDMCDCLSWRCQVITHTVHRHLMSYSTEYNNVIGEHDPFYQGFSAVPLYFKCKGCVQSYV